MFANLIAWFHSLFSSVLSHYILPVWNDIQTKTGPALGLILEAGLAAASGGHTAIFAAIIEAATKEGITLLDYEVGFIANSLQHPAAATATVTTPTPVPNVAA